MEEGTERSIQKFEKGIYDRTGLGNTRPE